MKLGMWDAWKMRMINWLEEPLGERVLLTEPEESVQKPFPGSVEARMNSTSGRDQGHFNEKAPNIAEFRPRGSAGHREIYSPRAHRKAVLPYAGKGVKHPK